jgi:SNF2 family DNA or RNA helicase
LCRPTAEARVNDLARLCARLGTGVEVHPRPAPVGLRAELRAYQQRGLGWLHVLGTVTAGGILADDMGLGKTVQLIAHLLELKSAGQLNRGALIVAPTSVIDTWAAELARFAPMLNVGRYHGSDRGAVWQKAERPDVTITTYSLLWRDIEPLAALSWDLAVLDEAQYIKNASARTAQAARRLNADRRLCLTGTPIENNLQDIWSLFEFTMPGFLGDEASFREQTARLSDDEGEAAFAAILRDRLRRRLAPFVLRRRKEEVLPDLPAKSEVVHAVAMTPAQADLYADVREEARQAVRDAVRDQGPGGARMCILTQLLRLRQVCCDPRLLERGDGPAASAADSAKLTAFLDLMAQLQAQGSRTLVFSQFTSMLALISDALRAEGRDHLILTGETEDRARLVERFQAGECPIFLISLRAGGVGLNLTAADSVIHYDPWWNPAVERQATDRSHRLGQTKPVFVYKLIVDDSIESKIQELQRTKLELARDLLSEGDIAHLTLDQSTIDYLLEE